MCGFGDPLSCLDAAGQGFSIAWDVFSGKVSDFAGNVAAGAAELFFGWIADGLRHAVQWMALLLTSWILIPSGDICPGATDTAGDWVAQCAASTFPAAQLRQYLLPISILITVGGIVWQGIAMAITRKGEPLLHVIRGLWNTALWGAVGIAGTQLALKAGDAWSYWILKKAIFGDSQDPTKTMGEALGDMLLPEAAIAVFVLILLAIIILVVTLVQIVLMVFREGAVVILAGLLQLAAAGSFTRTTSSWLPRVTAWMLTLVCYKAMAATVYATAFLLMGAPGKRNFIVGLAVLVLSILAMPAMLKFFNWTVGAASSAGSSLGIFGAATAAGLHAASSRAAGGNGARDHARYLDDTLPRPGTASGTGSGSQPPSGSSNSAAAVPAMSSGVATAPPIGRSGAAVPSDGHAGTTPASASTVPAAAAGPAGTSGTAKRLVVPPAGAAVATGAALAHGAAQSASRATDEPPTGR